VTDADTLHWAVFILQALCEIIPIVLLDLKTDA